MLDKNKSHCYVDLNVYAVVGVLDEAVNILLSKASIGSTHHMSCTETLVTIPDINVVIRNDVIQNDRMDVGQKLHKSY